MTKTARGTMAIRLYYVMACGVGGIYLPFFPRWLEARGMVGVKLGIIAGAAPAMGILAPTAFGVVTDALRLRGGMLQLACTGALLTIGALAFACAAGAHVGFGVLLFASLFFALFRSPMGFVADVVALELAPAVGTTYGRLRLWGSLGFIGAVPLGVSLVDPLDAAALPIVIGCFVTAALLASLRLPRRAELPVRGDRHGAGQLMMDRNFRFFLIAVFLGQCGHAAYDLCFSFRLLELRMPRPDFVLAWDLGTGAEVLLMAYSAPLFRAFSPLSLFSVASAAASFRWAAIAVVHSPAVLLALQPLHALSFGLAWLASVRYASRRFPSHSLATAQGLLTTAMGAGSAVGMVTWGPIYHRAGGAMVFAGAACFSACACVLAGLLDRMVRVSGF